MKTVINIVLAACVIGLIYVCYGSIMGPINFDDAKKAREKQVIARLIDIRKAQLEYRNLHNGQYTASFDTLIDFVKTAKLPFVKKEGVLSDTQLEAGMTEKKAMAIINKAKKTGNWKEVEKEGLMNFKRDTLWVASNRYNLCSGIQCRLFKICSFRKMVHSLKWLSVTIQQNQVPLCIYSKLKLRMKHIWAA